MTEKHSGVRLRNRIAAISLLTAALSLLAWTTAVHAGPAERIAAAVPACAWPDKLVPGPVAKVPEQFKIRAVQLPNGAAQVSIVEGFRFPISPEGKEVFANVKIEQSEAEKFGSDREAIIANIRWILSTSKDMESPEPLLVDMNGFEGPMINRATFTGTTLALIALFHEKEKLVLTIYLENAPPDKRAFTTKAEWNGMRDRFFVALTSCAAKALEQAGAAAAVAPGASPAAPAARAIATPPAATPPLPSTAPVATPPPLETMPPMATPPSVATPPLVAMPQPSATAAPQKAP